MAAGEPGRRSGPGSRERATPSVGRRPGTRHGKRVEAQKKGTGARKGDGAYGARGRAGQRREGRTGRAAQAGEAYGASWRDGRRGLESGPVTREGVGHDAISSG
ncbi:hypothetical protein GCM10018952_18930 [Streptosporangium vulgare]